MAGEIQILKKMRDFERDYEYKRFKRLDLPVASKEVNPWQFEAKESNDNLQKLLNIFPEELWLLVLGKISNPQFLETVANSSAFFRTLLEPRRVEYLLPNVLQIIAPALGFAFDERRVSFSLFYQKMEDEQGRKLKWFSTLFRMRQVCKSWKKSVDNFFATHRLHSPMTHDQNDEKEEDREHPFKFAEHMSNYNFTYTDTSKLDKFLQHFQASHEGRNCSPFIGNRVCIEDDQYAWSLFTVQSRVEQARDQSERLRNGFTELLALYGTHVWNCRVKIVEKFSTGVVSLQRLRYWLELMPNLRFLQIEYTRRDSHNTDKVWQELQGELANKSLPKLKHLKMIKAESLPVPVIDNLLANNCHIVKLDIQRDSPYGGFELGVMPNLTEFSMQLWSVEDVKRIDDFAPILQNLTKLHLPFSARTVTFEHWSYYLDTICKHWGNSKILKDLTIEVPMVQGKKEDYLKLAQHTNFQFPKVTRVKFILGVPMSLQFLLPLKDCLETLHLFVRYKRLKTYIRLSFHNFPVPEVVWDKEVTGCVDWLGLEDRMDESNIWGQFPKLNKITVEGDQSVGIIHKNRQEYFRITGGT